MTLDREYAMTWPGARTDRRVDAALRARPTVDVVHVQADFWGAFIGHRFAARHGLPVVHTMHNRVDVGIEATAPFPGTVLRVLNALGAPGARRARRADPAGHDGWAYLRGFAERADAVTAPSSHFARRLEAHGVVPGRGIPSSGERHVDVVWNGIDDDLLDAALASRTERAPGPPRLVWLGRMSPEKRLLPFLEALADIGDHGRRRGARRRGPAARGAAARRQAAASGIRRLLGPDAVRRVPPQARCRRRSRADLDRLRDAGHDAVRGRVARDAVDRERPRHRGRAGRRALAGARMPRSRRSPRRCDGRPPTSKPVRGRAVDPSVAARFRQSSRTAAMVEVYQRVLAA